MTYRTHSDTRQPDINRRIVSLVVYPCAHARSRVRYRNGMLTGGLMCPVVQSDGIETNQTERKENKNEQTSRNTYQEFPCFAGCR